MEGSPTVTRMLAERPLAVALTVADPGAFPVATPLVDTDTMLGFDELHFALRVMSRTEPSEYRSDAESCNLSP
jgi:hypothetical protein